MAEKKKDPLAAIKRAVERFEDLNAADRATVISRLKANKPSMALQDMAYVEEVSDGLVPEDAGYLLKKLEEFHHAATAKAAQQAQ